MDRSAAPNTTSPPRVGLVNDPSGPLVVNGVADHEDQYRDPMNENGLVIWGQATSADLG